LAQAYVAKFEQCPEAPSAKMWRQRSDPAAKPQIVGDYELGATLGQGTFGTVKVGTHVLTGQRVAIKIIPSGKMEQNKLEQEIRLQRRLSHQHVVQIHEVLEQDSDMHIVMELVSGGDLFDFIVKHVRVPEKEGRRLFQQIVAGVEHCHDCKVAHRDLKPENIFMDKDGNVKIGDFGLSAEICAGELLKDSCGSPNYAAPELLYKDCAYEGPEVDVWACGVILYAILASTLPFDAPAMPQLFRLIKAGRYSMPGFLSDDAKDLIAHMLVVDPTQRYSMADIREHRWFQTDLPPELTRSAAEPLHGHVVDTIEGGANTETDKLPSFRGSLDATCNSVLSALTVGSVASPAHPRGRRRTTSNLLVSAGSLTSWRRSFESYQSMGSTTHQQPVPCSRSWSGNSMQSLRGRRV